MSYRQQPPAPPKYGLTFHFCYATIIKAVDARYAIRGYMLAQLVKLCLKMRARIPCGQRAFYERPVQLEALTYLEGFTAKLLLGQGGRLGSHEFPLPSE